MGSASASQPPQAPRRPADETIHGRPWSDPYAWLRDRDDPATRAYLEAENAHTDAVMEPAGPLVERLYAEMVERIKEDDQSVPYRQGPFLYYARTETGKNYPIHCRRSLPQGHPVEQAGPEERYLDENVLAQGQDFFHLGDFDVTLDGRWVAYTVDTSGDERYQLRLRNLQTGEDLDERIVDTGGRVVWAEDGRTVLYTRLDEAHRPYEVWAHVMGTDPEQDRRLVHEPDDAYFLGIGRTRSRAYLLFAAHSQVSSEIRFVEAARPMAEPRIIEPRRENVEYTVEHHGDRFFIVTNDGATNFKVCTAPVDAPGRENWATYIEHRPDTKIDGVDAFVDHLVVSRRRDGLPEIVVQSLQTSDEHVISMDDPAHAVWVGYNPGFDTSVLRYSYSSLVTPRTVYDYDMTTRTRVVRKRTEVIGYDPSKVVSDRIFATAPDGARVPISLLRRASDVDAGPQPLYLMGYGSYGVCYDAEFASQRLSLVERGVTFAIAHVRGGGELGRTWYEDGKLLRKRNTFGDFIACAQALVDRGLTTPEQLAIYGGSAGGLLVGAVLNERPELFRVAVADVPFVDIVNTMRDASLPLTVVEWDEWGNPAEPEYFEYIASYSPYDNVRAQAYPHMLVLAGWSDPRVGYWEPAKWVAKLRATKTGDEVLLLRTNLDAGHAGPSGRYPALEERAFQYAFVLRYLGVDSD